MAATRVISCRRYAPHARWLAIVLAAVSSGCNGDEPARDAGGDSAVDSGPISCRRNEDCPIPANWCDGTAACFGGTCGLMPRCQYTGSRCAVDSCNEASRSCTRAAPDNDGDGHGDSSCTDADPRGDDCDDTDPTRFPGNPELCDPVGHDEDCDDSTMGDVDEDRDGQISSACCQSGGCGPDCDDTDERARLGGGPDGPGACDGIDNDCNGTVDDGCDCGEHRGDCDGNPGNGCESDLATGTSSCGACGRACRTGESCIGGVCNPAIDVDGGDAHTCAVLADGFVYCWGSNSRGQLGDGTFTDHAEPVRVGDVEGATRVALGWDFSCALLGATGEVRCWGYGGHGQLGQGEARSSPTPVTVAGLGSVAGITAGRFHACAWRTDGQALCWGHDGFGQLGDGGTARQASPVGVSGISGVTTMTAGEYHTCALAAVGTSWCWGSNAQQQVSAGSGSPVTSPIELRWPMLDLAAGTAHTCGIYPTSQLQCMGVGSQAGESGAGYVYDVHPVPLPIPLDTGAHVFAGAHTTCVTAAAAGDAVCFGDAAALGSPLGLGPSARYGSGVAPTIVPGIGTHVTDIAAGNGHTCFLHDGRVSCVGRNDVGQQGDGTSSFHVAPLQVRFP